MAQTSQRWSDGPLAKRGWNGRDGRDGTRLPIEERQPEKNRGVEIAVERAGQRAVGRGGTMQRSLHCWSVHG